MIKQGNIQVHGAGFLVRWRCAQDKAEIRL